MEASRRRFLAAAGFLAAGVAGLEPAEPQASPSGRHRRLKLSCCAYSVRQLLQSNPPSMDLFSFLDFAVDLGLEGVELTSYYFPAEIEGGFLQRLKRECHVRGLEISGGAVGNDFCLPPGEKREKEIALVFEWLEHYERLGAPILRIFAGTAPEGTEEDVARRWVAECIEECLPRAADAGIILALENHGGVTSDASGVLDIFRYVGDTPWLGANLDTGNFRTADPYADMAAVASRAVNVHGKIRVHPAGGTPEPVDYTRVRQILEDAGYRGFVALEYEGPEPVLEGIAQEIERMRQALFA